MNITDTTVNNRIIEAGISKADLTTIVAQYIATQKTIPVQDVLDNGVFSVEPNVEGLPVDEEGFLATFRAVIPIEA